MGIFNKGTLSKLALSIAVANSAIINAEPVLLGTQSDPNFTADQVVVGTDTVVNQANDVFTIDWQSFDVGESESVTFNQTSGQVAINNIHDADPSQIFGSINAGGTVFLSNSNGFIFGANSTVNTESFLATTSEISLTNGELELSNTTSNQSATINIQDGASISSASGGFIALISPKIELSGSLTSESGSVVLSTNDSTNGATLTLPGLGVKFPTDALIEGNNAISKSLTKGGTGSILSTGGTVTLSATDLNSVLSSVVDNPDTIQAEHLILDSTNTLTHDSGTLNYSGGEVSELTLHSDNDIELNSNVTGSGLKLNLTSDSDISIGTSAVNFMLGGNNGLQDININSSTLTVFNGLRGNDSITLNTDISFIHDVDTLDEQLLFTTTGQFSHIGNISTSGDDTVKLIIEGNSLSLDNVEGFGSIDLDASSITLSGDLSASTITTKGEYFLYLNDDITLTGSSINLSNAQIASYQNTGQTNSGPYGLTFALNGTNSNLLRLEDIKNLEGINTDSNLFTLDHIRVTQTANSDSSFLLGGDITINEFSIAEASNAIFSLDLTDNLNIDGLSLFNIEPGTVNGTFNLNVIGDNTGSSSASIGLISNETTLQSISISGFNDINLYDDITVSGGDISLSANSIYAAKNNSTIEIENSGSGNISLDGSLTLNNSNNLLANYVDSGSVQLNVVNGNISINDVSNLDSFGITKILSEEGNITLNGDINTDSSIQLVNLGDIDTTTSIKLTSNTIQTTGSIIDAAANDLEIEASQVAHLGELNANNIDLSSTPLANIYGDLNASNNLNIGSTAIDLQDNVTFSGNMDFLNGNLTPAINGNHNLILNALNSSITLYDFGSITALNSLTVEGTGKLYVSAAPIITGSAGLSLLGDLEITVTDTIKTLFNTSAYNGNLDLSGTTLLLSEAGTLEFDTGSGDLSLGNLGSDLLLEELSIKSAGNLNLHGPIVLATGELGYDFSKVNTVTLHSDMTFGSEDAYLIVNLGDASLNGDYSLTVYSNDLSLGQIGSNISLQDISLFSNDGTLILNDSIELSGTLNITANDINLNSDITNTGLDINITSQTNIVMNESATINAAFGDINLSAATGNIALGQITSGNTVTIRSETGYLINAIDDYLSNENTSVNITSTNQDLYGQLGIGTSADSPIVINVLNDGTITANSSGVVYLANLGNAKVITDSRVIDSASGGNSASEDALSQLNLSSLNTVNLPTVSSTLGLISNLIWQVDEDESIRRIKTPASAPSIYYSRKGWKLGH